MTRVNTSLHDRKFGNRLTLCLLLICSSIAAGHSDGKSLQLPQMGLVEAVERAETQLVQQQISLTAHYLARGEWIGAREELSEPYWRLTWRQQASPADADELVVTVDQQGMVRVVPQDTAREDAAMRRPELDAVDYIYALESFDIPDQAAMQPSPATGDGDGLRDRPRIVIWRNGHSLPAVPEKFEWTQSEVLHLLTDRYRSVEEAVWRNQFHHIADSVDGGIVLKSGDIIGWHLKYGGLGRLEFGYDPRTEKVSSWRLADEVATTSRWLYLARETR